jgi:hypothetical protein
MQVSCNFNGNFMIFFQTSWKQRQYVVHVGLGVSTTKVSQYKVRRWAKFSIITFSITTPSKMDLITILSSNNIQHYVTKHFYITILNVGKLSAILPVNQVGFLAKDKQSSLLGLFISYKEIKLL